jgi:putative membrane protein insertion efficiency factor
MQSIILNVIRMYQNWISPGLPNSCRFYPTCSEYAIQAIEKQGIMRGWLSASKRMLKCHPFHPGGYDPVP